MDLIRQAGADHIPHQLALEVIKGLVHKTQVQCAVALSPVCIRCTAASRPCRSRALGQLSAVALFLDVLEQPGELLGIVIPQGGELPRAALPDLGGDGGHVHHHKAGGQGLVELPGTGVAVVHGGDKAGGVVEDDPLVAGHVDGPAEVQVAWSTARDSFLAMLISSRTPKPPFSAHW